MHAKTAKTWQDRGREWLDTLVVAISVAMAFRAYFFEPFNIPTGSMQPTLYGNHSEPCDDPGVWQTTPLKWLNWLVSGRDYKEIVAPFDGMLCKHDRHDGRVDLVFVSASGQSSPITVPTDVLNKLRVPSHGGDAKYCFSEQNQSLIHYETDATIFSRQSGEPILDENGVQVTIPDGPSVVFPKGWKLWRGYDTSGDFIFVNRMRWNFRQPARGDVMVFSTKGIGADPEGPYTDGDGRRYLLQQGTHYIKRLTALPGEEIEIRKPDVYINGERIDPIKPLAGARGEPMPEPNAGRRSRMTGPVRLGEREYFACGDNSDNSLDSRYWGAVPERNLKGTGSWVFWPIINPRWGFIK